ncbi:MAG: M15 family metallopeptidase [Fusobacteriaceae bacterium]|nr:M15 family metallopeptidase [Fusobacteriaceae bacterium]
MRKKLMLLLFIMISYFSFGEEKSYLIKEGTPLEITNQMVVVEIEYIDYNGNNQIGKIVVNKKVSKEVIEIFKEIKESGFQIEKIIPISEYNWDDDKSMEDNNTSGYNYRYVQNSNKLSNHSYGMAIDINPRYNPMIVKGEIFPSNGNYSKKNKGTINSNSEVVKIFKKRGWKWGGDYKTLKDYQHFDKVIK